MRAIVTSRDYWSFRVRAQRDQLWKLVSKGTGTCQVQSVNSNECLDVTGVSSANGALS